jgi:Flp pilus assembly protein TadG
MTMRKPSRREFHGPRRVRGVAAVEFVIAAPFLLLLLVAAAEVGRAFLQYQTLSYAVRHSARYVSDNSINGTTGVISLSTQTTTRARNLAVFGNVLGTGSPKLPGYQISHVQIVNLGGDNIRVTATYPYQPMIGPVLPRFGYGPGADPGPFNMQIAVTLRAIS